MNRDKQIEELQTLEESLWKSKTRFDRAYMDSILAEDFFEFGRSGRTYTRKECLDHSVEEIHATLPLKNFTVHEISEKVFLVTYISEVQYEELEIGNRSSLWKKTEEGWKLKFHQGTAINK